ncbi:viral A-type inclusion protein, partial [Reticulomyxa filosa]
DEHFKDDLLGTAKFDCNESFKEVYLEAKKRRDEQSKDDLESKEWYDNSDNSSGKDHDSRPLSTKFDGTLVLETTRQQAENCHGSIQVSIECQVVQPLNTRSRVIQTSQALVQLNEHIQRLQTEKQELAGLIQQNDTKITEKENQKQALNKKIGELETEKKSLEGKRNGLESEVAELSAKKNSLSQKIESEKDGTHTLEQANAQLRSTLQQVENNIANAQNQLQTQTNGNAQSNREEQQFQNTVFFLLIFFFFFF